MPKKSTSKTTKSKATTPATATEPKRIKGRVAIVRNATNKELIIFATAKNKIKLKPKGEAGDTHCVEVTPWLQGCFAEGKIEVIKSRTKHVEKLYNEFTPPVEDDDEIDDEDEE